MNYTAKDVTQVVVMPKMCGAKCAMLKDGDYDVTPYIIAQEVRQMRGWSGRECEVYCVDG